MREKVAVIGGGNVAVDVALTALRLGAKKVALACLEKRDEMPANPWEIEQAQAEGVEMHYSWGPSHIVASNGKVAGLELVRCTSVFDENGNFCPYFDEARLTIEAEQVILAIGQASETAFCRDFCFLEGQGELPVRKGLIAIDLETQQTEMRGVFAGGDAANGPASVVEAIAAGRRAAVSIDRYLGGDGFIEFGSWKGEGGSLNVEYGGANGYEGIREPGFAERQRFETHSLPVRERRTSFAEVELGYDESQVKAEVRRCLQCDLEICLARQKRETEKSS
jgi:NADPH-dependent glutamate synthase beta subunit-like oxidoreductase